MENTYSLDLELGSSQYAYIAYANQTGLSVVSDISIECWVKFESLPASGANMNLVTRRTGLDYTGTNFQFRFRNVAGEYKLSIVFGASTPIDGFDSQSSDALTISTGVWYHFAVTRDRNTNTINFYQNTVNVGAPSCAGANTVVANVDFRVGAVQYDAGVTEFLDGLIDEVRVWSDVRTPTEIANNYDVELVGDEAGLVGYWRFNNDYLDQTSNNNDLTSSGSPTFSTDVPFGNSTGNFFNFI
jgi:hypothetical protein